MSYTPSHDIDAEQSLIGSALISPDEVSELFATIKRRHFYREEHGILWAAIKAVFRSTGVVDPVVLGDELRKAKVEERVGGVAYLLALMEKTPTAAHADHYAEVVVGHFQRRTLIEGLMGIVRTAKDPQYALNDGIGDIANLMRSLTQLDTVGKTMTIGDAAALAYEIAEDRSYAIADGTLSETLVYTGLAELDRRIAAMERGNFIVVAGRPGMGKSALMAQIGHNVASAGRCVLLDTEEMTPEQVARRFMAQMSGVDAGKLRTGYMTGEDFTSAGEAAIRLKDLKFDIAGRLGTCEKIRAQIQRTKAMRGDVALVIVDYLQLLRTEKERWSGTERMDRISNDLKQIALDENVVLMTGSQLSRAVEEKGRDSKRPRLGDLRESGMIEANADQVWGIYREAYYVKEAQSAGGVDWGAENIEEAEIIVLKHRDGEIGKARVGFIPSCAKFTDIDRAHDF